MSGKPVAEQEIGFALLQEVAHAETSMSKKILLHYFGEEFDKTGEGADMDDNVRNPKIKVEAKDRSSQQ
jgi:ATP-dependent DNA helicase RecQ